MESPSYGNLFRPDEVIAGRYRVIKVLGAGGMGVVLAARHLELDTLVAIKLLRAEVIGNPDIVARFAREARAAVRIKSEHVARVTDVSTLGNGVPFMVMEYLEGSDLAQLVEARGPLPVETGVDYVLQACEAIAEAHSLGIVHRDLKPGNLFLSRRADGSELVKVLDFGISKTNEIGGPGGSLTSSATILGSPTHMSPEQLSSSKNVDARTDIWALGVILHQILSGHLPFRADTLPELFVTILQTPPPPLRTLRPDVHPGVEAIVLRCLEKNRDARYANVGELAVALSHFSPARSRVSVERILRLVPVGAASGMSQTASALDGTAAAWPTHQASGSFQHTQGTWGHTASAEGPRTSRTVLMFGASALLVVGMGLGIYTWLASPANRVPSPTGTAVAPAAPSQQAAPSRQAPEAVPVAVEPVEEQPAREPPVELPSPFQDDPDTLDEPPSGRPSPRPFQRATPRPRSTATSRSAAGREPAPAASPTQPAIIASPVIPRSAPEPTKPSNGEWETDRK